MVNSSWVYGNDNLVINQMQVKYTSKVAWDELYHEIWLIYLTSLLNCGDYKELESVVKSYLGKYKYFREAERYLPLSNHLYLNGMQDFELSSKIYNYMIKNKKSLFNMIVEAKSIAIIGNGSSQVGKSSGQEIDSHDIVIRFNNFKTEGFEEDYGTKTDIWVRGTASNDIINRLNYDQIKFVVWGADYSHFKVHFDDLKEMDKLMKAGVCFTDLDNLIFLKKESGIVFPTTGLLFIWYVYLAKGRSLQNVKLFGFGFLSETVSPYNEHYFEKRNLVEAKKRSIVHDMEVEALFIQDLLVNKEI